MYIFAWRNRIHNKHIMTFSSARITMQRGKEESKCHDEQKKSKAKGNGARARRQDDDES
jgi:hypothetical protein